VALLGNFGNQNLGNEAVLSVFVDAIRTRRPDLRIVALSIDPEDTERRHGVSALPLRSGWRGVAEPAVEAAWLLRAIPRLRPLEALVVAGGGQLCDDFGGASNLPWMSYRWAALASFLGARILVLGVGAGPIRARLSRLLIRRVLAMAERRWIRDAGSARLLAGLPFEATLDVAPDPAFLYPRRAVRRESGVVALIPFPHQDERYSPEHSAAAYRDYLAKLVRVVRDLRAAGKRVLLVPTQLRADTAVIRDLLQLLTNGARADAVECPNVSSFDDVLDQLGRSELVIDSRFHGAVAALLAGRPLIALVNHPKLGDLMSEFGLDSFALPLGDFDPSAVTQAVARAAASRVSLESRIADTVAAYRSRIERQLDLAFGAPRAAGAGSARPG
jgi:polysaccharide pyruvyl transferase WcaK-like protein